MQMNTAPDFVSTYLFKNLLPNIKTVLQKPDLTKTTRLTQGTNRRHGVWLYRGRMKPVFWAFVHGQAAGVRPAYAGAACVNKYFVLLWRAGLAGRE